MLAKWTLAATVLAACSGDDPAPLTPDARPQQPTVDAPPRPPGPGVGILVASRGSDVVLRFDGEGEPAGVFASDPALVRPVGLTFGPDGHLYVAVGDTDRILRFDEASGASLGVFTHGATLVSPRNLNFGPDGALYVADGMLNQILRFDGATGAFDRVFIENAALQGPTSFTFGPDGDVYVTSVLTNRVLEFDGATGAFRGAFALTGLSLPHDLAFGPDGNLYVSNSGTGLIQRYRGDTGARIDTFVSDFLMNPLGLTFGPDGDLYVANQVGHDIRRYDGATGAFVSTFVPRASNGLALPMFLVFLPPPAMTLAVTEGRLVIGGARAGARVLVARGAPGGTGSIEACPDLELAVGDPMVAETRIADESGWVVADAEAGNYVAVNASRCVATGPQNATR